MGKRTFISYSHKQGEWVHDRLVTALKAGGAEVRVDRERFVAGKAVIGQMDATQDAAEVHLLVLSPEYVASEYCLHELRRAVTSDPESRDGRVIPVIRSACPIPAEIGASNPLRVDLSDDRDRAQWDLLMKACDADLGADVPVWLTARADARRCLSRRESVSLVVSGNPHWRELVEQLHADLPEGMSIVDLERGATASRRGLLAEMLLALTGAAAQIPPEPEDLVEFDRVLSARRISYLALKHFDLVAYRPHYGVDLFAALRHHLTETRQLVLLVQSRTHFAVLLPREHPLSAIDIKTVELPGRA